MHKLVTTASDVLGDRAQLLTEIEEARKRFISEHREERRKLDQMVLQ
jgi:hypothetical protein